MVNPFPNDVKFTKTWNSKEELEKLFVEKRKTFDPLQVVLILSVYAFPILSVVGLFTTISTDILKAFYTLSWLFTVIVMLLACLPQAYFILELKPKNKLAWFKLVMLMAAIVTYLPFAPIMGVILAASISAIHYKASEARVMRQYLRERYIAMMEGDNS